MKPESRCRHPSRRRFAAPQDEDLLMTFDDVRKFALLWAEVEDGTSYGTPALKVRKKLLARLREDGDSLVMPGVPQDEREMLVESQPKVFFFADHYSDKPIALIRLSKAQRVSSNRCCAGTGARSGQRRRLERLARFSLV